MILTLASPARSAPTRGLRTRGRATPRVPPDVPPRRRRTARTGIQQAIEKANAGVMSDSDAAMVKLYCSEMLCQTADDAVQIFGGMGLMEEMPIHRLWRDSRLERIWDGTSEIQRHIITRSILRPLGA